MNIQKAAVRASNNAMRGYIPHNAIVSQGAKIAARQQAQEKPQRGKKGRKRERLTEISTGSGKPVLKQNVGVVRAAKKLFEYAFKTCMVLRNDVFLGFIRKRRFQYLS